MTIPTKRELKPDKRPVIAKTLSNCNDHPDEKGIETWLN